MKKELFILFSESTIGVHSPSSNTSEEYHVIPVVFPVRVKKVNDKILYTTSLTQNKFFLHGVFLYKKKIQLGEKATIVVGHDVDDKGEAMASCMKQSLLEAGIPEQDIKRIPLTSNGYIEVKKFIDTSGYKEFIHIDQEFRKVLAKAGIKKNVGIIKAVALASVLKNKGKRLKIDQEDGINIQGTSSVTFVTRDLLKGKRQ